MGVCIFEEGRGVFPLSLQPTMSFVMAGVGSLIHPSTLASFNRSLNVALRRNAEHFQKIQTFFLNRKFVFCEIEETFDAAFSGPPPSLRIPYCSKNNLMVLSQAGMARGDFGRTSRWILTKSLYWVWRLNKANVNFDVQREKVIVLVSLTPRASQMPATKAPLFSSDTVDDHPKCGSTKGRFRGLDCAIGSKRCDWVHFIKAVK